MTPKIPNRLVPAPRGFDDEVKAKAAQAERSWELATGSVTFLGVGGGAALAAGLAIPPIAPFAAVIAAGSFYFKLRARWTREDPPRPDYEVATDFRPPQLDLMVLMPAGPIPPGAAIASLLFAAAASIEATVVTVERAMGASVAAREGDDEKAAAFELTRMREAQDHAQRSAALTAGLHAASVAIGPFLQQQLGGKPPAGGGKPPAGRGSASPRQQAVPRAPGALPGGKARVADMLDDRALGHVIASGIDARLLEVDVWRDFDSPTQSLAQVLADAGDAAEQFGAALARWTQDVSFGGPGTSEPI